MSTLDTAGLKPLSTLEIRALQRIGAWVGPRPPHEDCAPARALLGVSAIAFDVYGTLAQIRKPLRPYRRFLHALGLSDLELAFASSILLTRPIGFRELAETLSRDPNERLIASVERDVVTEVESIELFEDTVNVLQSLRSRGVKLATISNLAMPYAEPARRLPAPIYFEAAIWSFEVGEMKPSPSIYWAALDKLGVDPSQVLMVGDCRVEDVNGARRAGLRAVHLERSGVNLEMDSIQVLSDLLALSP